MTYLTTVFMEDVGEAVQDAVTTATVGASLLNPLPMRDDITRPADRQRGVTFEHWTDGQTDGWISTAVFVNVPE